jgi:hypothetical protein
MDAQYFHQQHACQVQLWIDFYCGRSYYFRCFWTSVFGVSYYFSLQQQSTQRQRFLYFHHSMGGCVVGSMLASVIWSLLFFGTPAHLLLLYSDSLSCPGDMFLITRMLKITNWIHRCDELKEEEGHFKKKDEGGMTTV